MRPGRGQPRSRGEGRTSSFRPQVNGQVGPNRRPRRRRGFRDGRTRPQRSAPGRRIVFSTAPDGRATRQPRQTASRNVAS